MSAMCQHSQTLQMSDDGFITRRPRLINPFTARTHYTGSEKNLADRRNPVYW